MLKRFLKFVPVLLITVLVLVGCGQNNGAADDGAAADANGAAEGPTMTIRMANALGDVHPTHWSLVEFAELVYEGTDGRITVDIFPNAMLGEERDVIEMVQEGIVEMSRVGAGNLEPFNSAYEVFSMPYVFQSREHYHAVMNNSQAVQDIFVSTYEQGFIGLGWLDSGQRSIYITADTVIETPADLAGKSIRVIGSPTSTAMMGYMGGVGVPMPFGEVYTALQQGLIDGAENNETALTLSAHGEVAQNYIFTMHQMTPDVIIVSVDFWNSLSDADQEVFRNAVATIQESHIVRWDEAVDEAVTGAKEMGVTFHHIDRTPFIEATQPMRDEFIARNDFNRQIMEDFLSFLDY